MNCELHTIKQRMKRYLCSMKTWGKYGSLCLASKKWSACNCFLFSPILLSLWYEPMLHKSMTVFQDIFVGVAAIWLPSYVIVPAYLESYFFPRLFYFGSISIDVLKILFCLFCLFLCLRAQKFVIFNLDWQNGFLCINSN